MLSILLGFAAAQAEFQPVSAEVKDNYVVFQLHTSDGKDHPFLVDSGANASYVLKSAISDHDKPRRETEVRLDFGKTQIFGNAQPVDPKNIPATVGRMKIEGILGINILRQIQLEIDYDARTVSARYGRPLSSPGPEYWALLMDRDADGLFTLRSQFRGKSLRICLDTGATALVFDPKKVDFTAMTNLSDSKLSTISGQIDTQRYLVESLSFGDHTADWMIACKHKLEDTDDGTIGASLLGGSKIVIDFPGSCVYVSATDPIGQAASRILGFPVEAAGNGIRFREKVPDYFKPYATLPILAVRRTKAPDLVSALKSHDAAAIEKLVKTYSEMRSWGLITTERNGKPELLPLQVAD